MNEGFGEFKVGRIKRSADPAPNNNSTPSKNLCRIGVAALLDAYRFRGTQVSGASSMSGS